MVSALIGNFFVCGVNILKDKLFIYLHNYLHDTNIVWLYILYVKYKFYGGIPA